MYTQTEMLSPIEPHHVLYESNGLAKQPPCFVQNRISYDAYRYPHLSDESLSSPSTSNSSSPATPTSALPPYSYHSQSQSQPHPSYPTEKRLDLLEGESLGGSSTTVMPPPSTKHGKVQFMVNTPIMPGSVVEVDLDYFVDQSYQLAQGQMQGQMQAHYEYDVDVEEDYSPISSPTYSAAIYSPSSPSSLSSSSSSNESSTKRQPSRHGLWNKRGDFIHPADGRVHVALGPAQYPSDLNWYPEHCFMDELGRLAWPEEVEERVMLWQEGVARSMQ